jgi:large repetitive protein
MGTKRRRVVALGPGRMRRTLSMITAAALASATLVGASFISPAPAQAAPGDPFSVAEPLVFVSQQSPTQLYRAVTDAAGTVQFQPEGSVAGFTYNAISYNTANNYLYGVSTSNALPGFPTGALIRIGEAGVITRVGTGLVSTETQFVGGFGGDGLLYTGNASSTTVNVMNTTTGAKTRTVTLSEPSTVSDWTFANGFFWGINNSAAGVSTTVVRVNPANGVVAKFPAPAQVIPQSAYGAAWTFGNGNLGFSGNDSGNVYQIAVTNPAGTPTFRVVAVSNGPSSSTNDGAASPGAPSDLAIQKSGPATFVSGERVSYDITVTNNGAGVSSGWTVTDALPAGLSNPTVIGDPAWSASGSTLTVTGGRLEVGASVTFQVEADTNVEPAACVVNTASVLGNEADPNLANNEDDAESCALSLSIEKTSDATASSRPGDIITYTVTATNTGAADYTDETPAIVFDDLSGVLDDADFNDDATASTGAAPSYAAPLISWAGALAVGESVEITYSATLRGGGDGQVRNVSWIPGDPEDPTPPTCDPATGGVDDATGQPCAVEEFDLPRLTIDKSVDTSELPEIGEQATFTVVVRNAGPGDYTAAAPATFADDLAEVLDDAIFDDASLNATVGTAVRSGTDLEWSGALAAGEEATVTYSVTYTGEGDQILRNLACIPEDETVQGTQNCDRVQVPGSLLTQWKTAESSATPVVAGSTITYTLHFDNDGQSPAAVDAVDDLTYVLDDATVTSEPVASAGLTVVRDGEQISVAGSVPVGQTSTVTYTVTVLPDGERGDSVATNFLLPPGTTPPPGGACDPTDPDAPNCTSTPITGVTYTKTVEASETPVRTGTELRYTILVTNTGATEVDVLRDDDLSGVLDDATISEAPESDTASVTVAGPVDGVLEIRGTLAAGETAEITYTATINPVGERGDNQAANFLVPPGTPPGECDPATEQCTVTPIQGFTVAKATDVDAVVPGGVVTYTVTVTNVGAVAYTDSDPASFEDDLSAVLDDASYNGDVSAGGTVTGNTLTWAGPLAIGESIEITYSVTVNDPTEGDSVLTNAVVPGGPTGECDPDGECTTETAVSSFTLSKAADTESARAGEVITYTVTVTNTGQVAYTDAAPASFQDDLAGVLDDATYNDDVSSGGSVAGTMLTWSGALGVGETVEVTYSVTVNDPLTGDRNLQNAVVPSAPGGSCDPDGECTTETPVASYSVTKTSDSPSALPGNVVTYTITVANTGDVAYTDSHPASFEDDLSGVLDDAEYNDDASSGATVSGTTLSWAGALAVGETIEVTYSVTVDDPITGDFSLINGVVPTGPGGSCEGACDTVTPIGSFQVVKSTTATEVVPGDVVEYVIDVTNTGQVAYTADAPASFTDNLSAVLDDATYNGDASSSSGSGVTYTAPQLAWTGALEVGETVTITYSVTVNDPATGDRRLENTVITPPGTGGNCVEGSTDPACVANVPAASYSVAKSASPGTALPGDIVTYVVTVTNTGEVAYTDESPASFSDDLSRVLDDAVYNGDVSVGGTVSGDILTWAGPLPVGATIQVTYTVTVDDPVTGDFNLRNVVTPTAPGGECVEDACITDTAVSAYTVAKSVDVDEVILGGVVTYTLTIVNTGQVAYTDATPVSVTDDLSDVLDDATYNEDATGGAEVLGSTLLWSGPLGVGEVITISYSVTVNQPATGDGNLRNTVTGDGPGGGCSTDGGCVTETPIASYRVTKDVSSDRAAIGDRVTFTITVTNTGQVAYTDDRPATFTDDLTSALAVGTYNGDATGGAQYNRPVLSWAGALEVGESTTVTYSVTLRTVGELRNVVVTPDGSGANCAVGASEADCVTTTIVVPPGLAITGGAAWIGGGIAGLGLLLLGAWLFARRRSAGAESALVS